MRIISIDPGYERLGIAVLEKEKKNKQPLKASSGGHTTTAHSGYRMTETLVFSECFKTSNKLSHHERLTLIGNKIKDVIEKYEPKALATEKLFFSGNQKTAMQVSEARGVILYTGSSLGLDVFEYTPNDVKIAVTGYGRAEKHQVMDMVRKLITIDSKTNSDDELDAIAIGLTHFAIQR